MSMDPQAVAQGIAYSEIAALAQQARERAAVIRSCYTASGTTTLAADILDAKAAIYESVAGDIMEGMRA